MTRPCIKCHELSAKLSLATARIAELEQQLSDVMLDAGEQAGAMQAHIDALTKELDRMKALYEPPVDEVEDMLARDRDGRIEKIAPGRGRGIRRLW